MDDLTQRAWVFLNYPRELKVHHLFLLVLSVWYYSSPMAIKMEIFNFLPPETFVLLELVLVYLSQMESWIVCAANRKVVSKGWHQSCDDLNKRAGKCPNKIFWGRPFPTVINFTSLCTCRGWPPSPCGCSPVSCSSSVRWWEEYLETRTISWALFLRLHTQEYSAKASSCLFHSSKFHFGDPIFCSQTMQTKRDLQDDFILWYVN